MIEKLKLTAEAEFENELAALKEESGKKPYNWQLTPQAVVLYLMGGKTSSGYSISPKYVGHRRIIETAVATLATDRALLLLGVPGTAKSWVSEHLSAAISGDSTCVIQCTAGTDEQQIRYGWNYAQLLSKGPSKEALVATPLFKAMETGALCRLEELTRMGSDVQDTLITILSEKMLPIPEINDILYASRGFNIIATANNRDKGVNELSSALKRRFNAIELPLPTSLEEEITIITRRVAALSIGLDLHIPQNIEFEIAKVVTLFRELRSGATLDGSTPLKIPSGNLSTAEAIAVVIGGLSQACWFGQGQLNAENLSSNIVGAIVKDPAQDKQVLKEYLELVVKKRSEFADYYRHIDEALY